MGERINIPELAESEDEKIRKQLVEIVKRLGSGIIEIPENIADIFAWLEKQKEQKPASISCGHENDKPTEDWREKRKEECPFRKADGCVRYANVVSECTGNCSWVVNYQKLKEIQDREEQDRLAPSTVTSAEQSI